MKTSFERVVQHLPLAAMLLCLAMGGALAESGDVDSGPAVTTTEDLDSHMTETESPDDMVAGTEDPNDLEGHGESPDDLTVGTRDPDSMDAQTEQLDDHEGHDYELSDLPEAAPDRGFEAIEMPGQKDWQPTTDPSVIVARRHLLRAQERAREARRRYGIMMENDYPRGEAREIIVRERDESMAQLQAAERALREVDPTLPPASPY